MTWARSYADIVSQVRNGEAVTFGQRSSAANGLVQKAQLVDWEDAPKLGAPLAGLTRPKLDWLAQLKTQRSYMVQIWFIYID